MESLALLAAIIMLSTLAAGIASVIVVVRRPRHIATRLISGTVGVVALAAGANIARLEIGIGARAMGALTAAFGIAALVISIIGRRDTPAVDERTDS
ncbi:MAG: hypothetical protein ACKOYG_10220 [Ilumatobacteraceae bacterium]